MSWGDASDRTKRYYLRKASQAVSAVMRDISPHDTGPLLQDLVSLNILCDKNSSDEDSTVDQSLMESLAECYSVANNWGTRRQILSIMADKVHYSTLLRFIPNLSRYRYTEARRHCMMLGRGAPIYHVRAARTDVPQHQIEHFIDFITSSRIVQDLPFGEKSIKLSSKESLKMPNVIRVAIPERIVQQYLAYCDESATETLSRSTLLRILSVCSASTRKSLQGLDYISSSGADAFEELLRVVEKLADAGQGTEWAKNLEKQLRASKRYLKSDYKVHLFTEFKGKKSKGSYCARTTNVLYFDFAGTCFRGLHCT